MQKYIVKVSGSILDISIVHLNGICIGNSMVCSDIWHKYHK